MNLFLEKQEKSSESYAKIGEQIDMDPGVIHHILHEDRKCSLNVIMIIAKHLGIKEKDALEAWKDMMYRIYLREKDKPRKKRKIKKD
jgi:hypothetical protein